jgi:hypothetical protein
MKWKKRERIYLQFFEGEKKEKRKMMMKISQKLLHEEILCRA